MNLSLNVTTQVNSSPPSMSIYLPSLQHLALKFDASPIRVESH